MTASPQRLLNLRIDGRVALVTVDFVRTALGCDAEEVVSRIEAGELRWAFDLSTGKGEVREIRIWAVCLTDPDRAALALEPEVIEDVIGGNPAEPEVRAARLERRLIISDQTFRRLRLNGDLTGRVNGRTLWLSRPSLVAFFQRRLIR